MRSNAFKEIRISLYIFALILACCILFYLFASMFTSMGYDGFEKAKNVNAVSAYEDIVIVIDAGHGGEDPGAVANGLIEKDLNLDVSLKLSHYLTACGYKTVLTRDKDMLLYGTNGSATKKQQDLSNRVSIASNHENSYFISVHMNKFPAEYCKGLQTFYSENNAESKLLAESVQSNALVLQADNKRVIKNGTDTIYVLENINNPAILIECGFLSNAEEAALLCKEDYKKALAFTIYCGIAEFLENI